MTTATMSTARIAEADAAELEAQRVAAHAQASADLKAVESEWNEQVPGLADVAEKAKAKLDRAQKALDQARQAHDEATGQADLLRWQLSHRRDSAKNRLAANADPAWDVFTSELRTAGAEALKSRHDLVVGGGLYGPASIDRSLIAHNASAKRFWEACQRTIDVVRDRKRQLDSDAQLEIPALRSKLPTIETSNA